MLKCSVQAWSGTWQKLGIAFALFEPIPKSTIECCFLVSAHSLRWGNREGEKRCLCVFSTHPTASYRGFSTFSVCCLQEGAGSLPEDPGRAPLRLPRTARPLPRQCRCRSPLGSAGEAKVARLAAEVHRPRKFPDPPSRPSQPNKQINGGTHQLPAPSSPRSERCHLCSGLLPPEVCRADCSSVPPRPVPPPGALLSLPLCLSLCSPYPTLPRPAPGACPVAKLILSSF